MTRGSGIAAVLYVVLLVTAVWSVQPPGDDRLSVRRGFSVATATALLVVGIPTLLQLTVAHGLLDHLERDRVAIGSGQLWRLVTSLIVQDGGWSGAVVNLVFLVVLGIAAERVWGARRWLVLVVASGVGAQLWGLLVQPVGAGNSVVNFGLAASLAVLAAQRRADPHRLLAMISLLVAVVLLAAGDIHGGAAAIGATTGAVLARDRPAPTSR